MDEKTVKQILKLIRDYIKEHPTEHNTADSIYAKISILKETYEKQTIQ